MNPEVQSRFLRHLATEPALQAEKLLRRASHQIEFAGLFADALPEGETAGWKESIETATAKLESYDPATGIGGLEQTVRDIETGLAAIGRKAKEYTVHCVGHGHIDMNWMWSWPETVATTHDTFASVLSFMDQYPDFTYSQSQASVYALMEKYYPDLFARIQQRVREGRWEVTAVHWVEGDKNISSGESLARHLLYTRRYFEEKFGLKPEDVQVDWEPDTFGHANTIPGILNQGGVKHYYCCRPGGGHGHDRTGPERPAMFWWKGLDGSQVLVNREITWYNSYETPSHNVGIPLSKFVKETGLKDWLNVYGVGNHGGGPTRAEIEFYVEAAQWPIFPTIEFSTTRRFFQRIENAIAAGAKLPTLEGELNYEFTGCYTSQSAIKKANRFGENYCVEAETLALINQSIGGGAVPKEQLRDAWISVLFNQFHDILPGSGVAATRNHALGLFQETGAITGAIKRTAGTQLASSIDSINLLPDTPEGREERETLSNATFVAGAGMGSGLSGISRASGGGRRFLPFVVYNPCAWTRSEPVTVTLYDTPFNPNRIVARDENGVNHPTVFVEKERDWGHEKIVVMFNALDIPALGYKTFLFCEGEADTNGAIVKQEGGWFESPHYRVRADRTWPGFEFAAPHSEEKESIAEEPFGGWIFTRERSLGMTAWVLGDEEDPIPLQTAALHRGYLWTFADERKSQPLFHLKQQLSVTETESTVTLYSTLHACSARIDVEAHIDWREIGTQERGIPGLSVVFPTWHMSDNCLYETPFGRVERGDYVGEVPTLRYSHIGGTVGAGYQGLTVLQDSKYGFHRDPMGDYRMRVLRSSFDPDHAPEVAQSTLRYAMVLHDEIPSASELTRMGAEWNHPLIVYPALMQKGDRPASASFARVATPNVVLTALKEAENGRGIVLRLSEYDGVATEAVVELSPELAAGLSKAEVVDLMERPASGSASFDGRSLRVQVPARGFVTVLVR